MKEANGKILKLAEQIKRPIGAPGGEDSFHPHAAYPREFLHNRFVYVVVSPRARGLSVGVNMNPDKRCQFNCLYCEVDRQGDAVSEVLDVGAMAAELKNTLDYIYSGRLRELHAFSRVPDELLQVRHVALSGDGEPT